MPSKVETKMKVVASKKLQDEIDKELDKKDKAIATVLPKTTEESNANS